MTMAGIAGLVRMSALAAVAAAGVYVITILLCPGSASAETRGGLLPAADCLMVVF
jgi:hypothetical protein